MDDQSGRQGRRSPGRHPALSQERVQLRAEVRTLAEMVFCLISECAGITVNELAILNPNGGTNPILYQTIPISELGKSFIPVNTAHTDVFCRKNL